MLRLLFVAYCFIACYPVENFFVALFSLADALFLPKRSSLRGGRRWAFGGCFPLCLVAFLWGGMVRWCVAFCRGGDDDTSLC